jgi:hypothetical protein
MSDTDITNRYLDLQYLYITLVLVILITIIYYVGLGGWQQKPCADVPTAAAPALQNTTPKVERFAPYASILVPDIQRSDTQFDRSERTINPKAYDQRSSEDTLFDQAHAVEMAEPLY